MKMNSLERFRSLASKRKTSQANLNSHFIFKGYPSIEITSDADNFTTVQASVVSQQEKDKAYIYTQLEDVLALGSTWGAKGLHWLVAEEIVTIKDVDWNKYLAYLCNINVEDVWGFFKGPEKNYVNIKNEHDSSLESLQKPVLVLPEGVLGYEDKIVIKNRPWLVQEYDAISSPGIVYYSLRATTVSKEVAEEHEGEDVYIERAQNNIEPIQLTPEKTWPGGPISISSNVDITLNTEEGHFRTNKNVKIKKHTATEVIFSIPFGVTEVVVETMKDGGVVTRNYRTK